MQTTVINIRGMRCVPPNVVKIDRSTIFGNPFIMDPTVTRDDCIAKYRVWFYERLKDYKFKEAVHQLHGKILGCWCKPLACHGDIIAEYLNRGDLCLT